jgi:hypothetical protein
VEDLDRQVLALLPEDLLEFFPQDLAGAVMGIDDAVPDLELDMRDGYNALEIVEVLFR